MFTYTSRFSLFSCLPHSWIVILAVSSLFVCSVADFSQTSPQLDLLAQKVNISVSQTCNDEFECRSQFNSTTCRNEGVCTESSVCIGRMDFPVRHHPLQNWQMTDLTAACAINNTIPQTVKKPTLDGDVRTLYVNGSSDVAKECNARGNLSDYDVFTLNFWLSADCTNCSVLELSLKANSPIHFRVVDGMLCVADDCGSNVEKEAWTFVAVKVYERAVTVFADSKILNLTSTQLQDVDIENIFIGSREVASPGNEFSLYDVQFYEDVLTLREIKELHSELANTINGSCRCPASHPIFLDSGTECEDEAGNSHARYDTSVHFNTISVLFDPSIDGKWASAKSGNVILLLAFTQPHEVESVKIEFASVLPGYVSMSLKFLDVGDIEQLLQCTGSKCENEIVFQQSTPSITVGNYSAKIADEIKIALGRDNPSDVQSFIISSISISGRCDCHGNADTCTVTEGTYACQCKADTNSVGPNCKSCAPNFSREATDFDCPNPCSCSASGVTDVSDQCEEIGGQCRCKEHVTGPSCNECVPWTYGLDASNDKGCSPCTCSQNGTLQCNNITGECTCKSNTESPNCDTCAENHFGFDTPVGCSPCNCAIAGTKGQKETCDVQTGQCECKHNVEVLKCDQCKPGFFSLDVANSQGCIPCDCHPVGIDQDTCSIVSGQCMCRDGVITDRKCSPEIISIDPSFGPEIGGTKLTIHGHLLGNSSHQASVFFGTQRQNIVSIDDSVIIVDTSQYDNSQDKSLEIKLSWAKVSIPLASSSFSYQSNPVLDLSKAADVYTYISGGCIVEVFGSNLRSVKYPRLDLINTAKPNDVAHGTCEHFRDYVMCVTPAVNHLYNSSQDEFQMTAVFDGVTSSSLGKIFVREDPTLYNAGNIRFQYPFETTITLRGNNLQTACQTNGIEVLTGDIRCTIVSISNTHIECEPPGSSPEGSDKNVIKVTIRNTMTVVGTLEYLKFYETDAFIIICSCIGAVILLVIIVIIFCRCRRYRKQRSKATIKLTDNRDTSDRQMNTYTDITQLVSARPNGNGHSGMVLMENVVREPKKGIVNSEAETSLLTDEFLPYVEPSIRDTVKDSFVGWSSFIIGPCQKTGQHARIMNGTLQRNGAEIQKLTIRSLSQPISGILKTSQSDSGPTLLPWANLALSECLRLRQFKHNHILNCLGIGFGQQRFHLLYSHSKKGSLKDIVANTDEEFSIRQLLGFSQQVAGGIAYLASKDVTHKDVAARNCMFDECSVVKIGDASFSWDFYPKEYVYNEQRERYLPIRWMAPESLTAGYYDMRTDVWSFGVLIWELLTRGCLPFHEINDDQVTDYVLNGYILGKPETISDNVYELLRNCWSPENETRPSIATLSRSLSNILESENDDTYTNGYLVTAQLTQGVSTPRRGKNVNSHVYNSTDLSHV